MAVVRAEDPADRQVLADAVLNSLTSGRERKSDRDAVYGVLQLSSMAWAAIAQPDPEAAIVAVAGLHTLLAEWTRKDATTQTGDATDRENLAIIYPDTTIEEVLSSLTSAIVASSSHDQNQTCAAVLGVFAVALPRLSSDHQGIAVTQLHRILPGIRKHSYTTELQRELGRLSHTVTSLGHHELAARITGIEADLAA